METESSFGGLPIPPIITNRRTNISNKNSALSGDFYYEVKEPQSAPLRRSNPQNIVTLPKSDSSPTGSTRRFHNSEETDSNEDFLQYVRRRTKRFYVGGFKPSITKAKLAKYVGDKGPTVTKVSVFRNKKYKTTVVRINIEDNEMANLLVNDPYFWPDGMQCRPWLSHNCYKNRHNEVHSGQKNQTDNYGRSRYRLTRGNITAIEMINTTRQITTVLAHSTVMLNKELCYNQ